LYHCDNNGSCSPVTSIKNGYYKNVGNESGVGVVPYIRCTSTSCKAKSIPQVAVGGKCDSTQNSDSSGLSINIGDIIFDGTDYFICLGTTAALTIKLDTTVTERAPDNYFISINAANVYNGDSAVNDKYVAIDLFGGNALLQTKGMIFLFIYNVFLDIIFYKYYEREGQSLIFNHSHHFSWNILILFIKYLATSFTPIRYQYTSTAFKITPRGGDGTMCSVGQPVEDKIIEFKASSCQDSSDIRVIYYDKL